MSLFLERIYVGLGLWGLFAVVNCTPTHRCDDVTFPNWLWIIRICRRERERKKSSAAKSMARGVKRWGRGIRRSEDNRILTPDDGECRAGSDTGDSGRCWRTAPDAGTASITRSAPALRPHPPERFREYRPTAPAAGRYASGSARWRSRIAGTRLESTEPACAAAFHGKPVRRSRLFFRSLAQAASTKM